MNELDQQLANLPEKPGVYQFFDFNNQLLYIGKAKNLKNRVKSYFQSLDLKDIKTKSLVKKINYLKLHITESEELALVLEANLIKTLKPKYNILLKDDKRYLYIKFDLQHPYPRLYKVRNMKKDTSLYFGPITVPQLGIDLLQLLNKNFKIRDCSDNEFNNRKRPCINYEMNTCDAPCVGYLNQKQYENHINLVKNFFNGELQFIIDKIKEKMNFFSIKEEYELAALERNKITYIEKLMNTYSLLTKNDLESKDIIFFEILEDHLLIFIQNFRLGIASGSFFQRIKKNKFIEEEMEEQLKLLILMYYENTTHPNTIIFNLPTNFTNEFFASLITIMALKKMNIKLLNYDQMNLTHPFQEQVSYSKEQFIKVKSFQNDSPLLKIKSLLKLDEEPFHIECIDISNFQGKNPCGSVVVFKGENMDKSQYRHYKFENNNQQNDFGMISELISRRFFSKEKPYPLPDLLIIDGGKGQLNSAKKVFDQFNTKINLVSIAKSRTQGHFEDTQLEESSERVFEPNRQNPHILKKGSAEFLFFTQIRDEAHRFAISFQRKLELNHFMKETKRKSLKNLNKK